MSPATTLQSVPEHRPVRLGPVDLPLAPRRRLAELGLRTGATVEVVHRTAGGGRVVAVAGARIALDRRTAQGIQVVVAGEHA
ncbi:FeoA family protein [Arsenicicoccus dermatophilus]|uniref:FeoA family protein n=1 Tax=Arsenicicoccus dermatophilus TaxID=1076331 RepID=UPI001F4D2E7E|nr:FeoA family protein [Arsenicicoccus dermatophilus]MCH8612161.1 ferrous iron transport protein A [Arsenicicoccus dermatophilus]